MLKAFSISAASLLLAGTAHAAAFNFTFTSDANVVLASGDLTTADTPDGSGAYALLSISGTANGEAITGLFTGSTPTFTYSNSLFLGQPDVLQGNDGIAFSTATTNYNIYYASGFGGTPANPDGQFDGAFNYPAGNAIGVFALTAAPEPASWAMMIGGFGLVGGALRRRARTTVRFA